MSLDLSRFKRIVVLTGAGVSAESGIRTFRDSGGLWHEHRIEEVATPEAFASDPVLVWRFYSNRRRDSASAVPNAAHLALAKYAASCPAYDASFTLITQNIDALHERAAHALMIKATRAAEPIAMHGSLIHSRCLRCKKVFRDFNAWLNEHGRPSDCPALDSDSIDPARVARDRSGLPLSPCCHELLRPHIVWFGETPFHMPAIDQSIRTCDFFASIGTSGQVYPAAGFLERARSAGAVTACFNKEPTPLQGMVDFYVEGPAASTLPGIFRRYMAG